MKYLTLGPSMHCWWIKVSFEMCMKRHSSKLKISFFGNKKYTNIQYPLISNLYFEETIQYDFWVRYVVMNSWQLLSIPFWNDGKFWQTSFGHFWGFGNDGITQQIHRIRQLAPAEGRKEIALVITLLSLPKSRNESKSERTNKPTCALSRAESHSCKIGHD